MDGRLRTWHGMAGMAAHTHGMACPVKHDMSCHAIAMAWQQTRTEHGMAWHGTVAAHGMAGHSHGQLPPPTWSVEPRSTTVLIWPWLLSCCSTRHLVPPISCGRNQTAITWCSW